MNITGLIRYIFPFTLTCFFILLLTPIAIRQGLVDKPGGRKLHEGEIPLIGGVAMFIAFVFTILTLKSSLFIFRPLFAASFLLIIVGVLDDFHELSTRVRFLSQIIAALIMVSWGGNTLQSLGDILFVGDLHLGYGAIIVTVIATVGIINAVNMMDGMDGLAGTLAFIEFAMLAILAKLDDKIGSYHILVIVLSVLLGFLVFNFPVKNRKKHKIFMGDAGSMFIGFTLVWFLISLSQGSHPVSRPVTMLWIMSVPLFDTMRVMIHRSMVGKSPFAASRDHLHHILAACGFSHLQIILIIASLAMVLGLCGIVADRLQLPEGIMFVGFVVLGVGHYCLNTMIQLKLGRQVFS